eukprot:664044-Rhodomonas_salina.1
MRLQLLLVVSLLGAVNAYQSSLALSLGRSRTLNHGRSKLPSITALPHARSRPSRTLLALRMEDDDATKNWMGRGQVWVGDVIAIEGPVSPIDGWGVDKTNPRWTKNTKQVATVGPASKSKEMLQKLFEAGVDMFRLNFSHGAHQEKEKIVKLIRELEKQYRHPIGILADLQGPKLRVGTFKDGPVDLKDGQLFTFDLDADSPGDETRVSLPHPEIISTLKAGDTVLLDDGKLRMTVTQKKEDAVECR